MKLRLYFNLILLLVGGFYSQQLNASHASGGYLTLKYSGGGNIYQVKYVFYRDCSGLPAPISVTVNYSWNNGVNQGTINLTNLSNILLSGSCIPSGVISCVNGVGIEEYIYQGNVTLYANNVYAFVVSENNLSIITTIYNLPGGAYFISEAMINLQAAPGNSLPDFNAQSQLYFCLNQYINFNNSATDINGDSIVYSLVPINGSAANISSYIAPYSFSNFISSSSAIFFDSLTGFVSFIPNLIQYGWIAIKIDEYRNGILIGSILRQTSMRIVNGTVAVPELNNEPEIKVFPNPAVDFLQIDKKEQRIVNWVITDATGRMLKTGYDSGNTVDQIAINDISPGLYFITLNNGKRLISKKFVKE